MKYDPDDDIDDSLAEAAMVHGLDADLVEKAVNEFLANEG